MNSNANTMWDPLNDNVTLKSFTDEQVHLVNDFESVRKKPYLLKLYLAILFVLAILTLISLLFTRIFQLIIGFIPLFWYYGFIMNKQEKITAIVKRVSKKSVAPDPEESLFDSGYLDSFALTDMVTELELELEFGLSIPDTDLSPRHIEQYLETRD